MSGQRILLQTAKFRIVELHDGNKVVERADGADALGVERWRLLKFAEAADTATMLRDWIFSHLSRCDQVKEQNGAEDL